MNALIPTYLYRLIMSWLLILLSAAIVWGFAWSSIILIVLAAVFFAGANFKSKLQNIISKKLVLWPTLLFLIYAIITFLFSEDLDRGLFVLQKKLPFIIIPIIVGSTEKIISKKTLRICLLLFSATVTLYSLLAIFKGTILFLSNGSFPVYHDLSGLISYHAIYFSFMVALSLVFVLHYFINLIRQASFSLKVLLVVWPLFLLVMLLLLASKIILVSVFLLATISIVWQFAKVKGRFFALVAVLPASMLLAASVYFFTSAGQRFKTEIESNKEVAFQEKYRFDTPFTGTTIRMTIWRLGYQLVNENKAWIQGLGPGDSQNMLDAEYVIRGIYTGNKNFGDRGYLGYNTHNQYFQTIIDIGLIGLAIFFLWLFYFFRFAFKNGNQLLLFILVLFSMFSLSESTLESQRGILPFILFTTLIITSHLETKNLQNG